MFLKKIFIYIILFLFLLSIKNIKAEAESFDIVIKNGDIYDPVSGILLNGYSIGINGNKIETITKANIISDRTIDATGRLVTPGFIDSFQREYGLEYDKMRIYDGVTSSIYFTDSDAKNYTLLHSDNVNFINRGNLFNISNLFIEDINKSSFKSEINKINESIQKNIFIGYFIEPKDDTNLNFVKFLEPSYTIYISGKNLAGNISQYLNNLLENLTKNQKVHLISLNYHFDEISKLLELSKKYDNLSFGGYTFGYLNIKPSAESDDRFKKIQGSYTLDTDNNIVFSMDSLKRKDEKVYPVFNLIKDEMMNQLLISENFLTESFTHYPASRVFTQGANAFLGKIYQSIPLENLFKTINSQTSKPRELFLNNNCSIRYKGTISVGADADLLIFAPQLITKYSNMIESIHFSEGLDTVIRDGIVIFKNGQITPETPKAKLLNTTNDTYSDEEEYTISVKKRGKITIQPINYKGKTFLPINDIVKLTGKSFNIENSSIYIGNVIRSDIGMKSFSVASEKKSLNNGIILLDGKLCIMIDDIANIFNDFYDFELSSNKISMKPLDRADLLDNDKNDKSNINIKLSNYHILLSYAISLLLIFAFIVTIKKK